MPNAQPCPATENDRIPTVLREDHGRWEVGPLWQWDLSWVALPDSLIQNIKSSQFEASTQAGGDSARVRVVTLSWLQDPEVSIYLPRTCSTFCLNRARKRDQASRRQAPRATRIARQATEETGPSGGRGGLHHLRCPEAQSWRLACAMLRRQSKGSLLVDSSALQKALQISNLIASSAHLIPGIVHAEHNGRPVQKGRALILVIHEVRGQRLRRV